MSSTGGHTVFDCMPLIHLQYLLMYGKISQKDYNTKENDFMKDFYLDIDTAYVAVRQYLSRVCEVHGIRAKDRADAERISETLKGVFGLHYSEIPKVDGADECLKIIETEYNVVFVSRILSSTQEEERKRSFAKSEGADIMFYKDNISEIDMSGGVFLSSSQGTLVESNAETKYLLYDKYTFDKSIDAVTVVFDWHSLLDIMIRGEEDEELREYFHNRVSPLFFGKRDKGYIPSTIAELCKGLESIRN